MRRVERTYASRVTDSGYRGDIRVRRRMTQKDVADTMGLSQTSVSTGERQPNPTVRTLRAYIEAMGGELEVVAKFGSTRIKILFDE